MSSAFCYPVERFAGPATELAEALRPLGIRLRTLDHPCIDHREGDRHRREIGYVAVHGPDRVVAWVRSDATDPERMALLRTAERVITHGTDGPASSWERRTTTAASRTSSAPSSSSRTVTSWTPRSRRPRSLWSTLSEPAAQLDVSVLAADRYLLRAGVQVLAVSNSLRLRRFNPLASTGTDGDAGGGRQPGRRSQPLPTRPQRVGRLTHSR